MVEFENQSTFLFFFREKPETQVALDAMVHKDLKVNPDLLELLVSQEKADLW